MSTYEDKKISLAKKIALFLRENKDKSFTANEIARNLVSIYPEEYKEKKYNSNFSDEQLISQLVSEIGSKKTHLLRLSISWDDFQKPRKYFYKEDYNNTNRVSEVSNKDLNKIETIREAELYKILMEYLSLELGLYCMRIRENTSKNSMGSGANEWLHPDIVAMQVLDKDFTKDVKELLRESGSSNICLWSFEVKTEINFSNLRKSFFQTVSNSSWANEGYLAAVNFAPTVESDLRILSSLHGIGVIQLNVKNPLESEILLPSFKRVNSDWQSINRIAKENKDFTNFIKKVKLYTKTQEAKDLPTWNQ